MLWVELINNVGIVSGEQWRNSAIHIHVSILPQHLSFGSPRTVENSERDGNTRPLTCLLRNLYAGQKATVRTGHGITEWFQIGKGVRQGCILSPCLFNFYAEYIMRNAGLDKAQAGFKIAGRNISNLRYADDTILRQKVKKNLRASWWKWKRRVKKLA